MSPTLASSFGELRIVVLLALVEAGVLQEHDAAVAELRHRRLRLRPDAIVDEADRPPDHIGDRRRDRLQRHFRHALSLRPLEMREQRHLGALVRQRLDGRRHALDPRRVGHRAVLHRHVQIDAQKHALSLQIAGVFKGPKRHLEPVIKSWSGSLLSLRAVRLTEASACRSRRQDRVPPPPKTCTRLDKAIRRLEAQRACLDWAVAEIADVPGHRARARPRQRPQLRPSSRPPAGARDLRLRAQPAGAPGLDAGGRTG